jgi:hypothetical protein
MLLALLQSETETIHSGCHIQIPSFVFNDDSVEFVVDDY